MAASATAVVSAPVLVAWAADAPANRMPVLSAATVLAITVDALASAVTVVSTAEVIAAAADVAASVIAVVSAAVDVANADGIAARPTGAAAGAHILRGNGANNCQGLAVMLCPKLPIPRSIAPHSSRVLRDSAAAPVALIKVVLVGGPKFNENVRATEKISLPSK